MDILPEDTWLPLLTVGAGPAKLAVSAIITSEVSWFIRRGQWGLGGEVIHFGRKFSVRIPGRREEMRC